MSFFTFQSDDLQSLTKDVEFRLLLTEFTQNPSSSIIKVLLFHDFMNIYNILSLRNHVTNLACKALSIQVTYS